MIHIGRRRWGIGIGAALVAGCTSKERGSAPEPEIPTPLTRPSEVQPILIADYGAPVSGASSRWTLYDDGWATLSESGGMFIGEEDYEGSDRTLLLPAAEVDVVREMLADPEFAGAQAHYHEEGVMDGGATTYVGGAPLRRIVVGNRPELPGALGRLSKEVELLSAITQRRGVDPFVDEGLPARARILLRHDWWGGGVASGADRVTVWDDGLLEYRVTRAEVVPKEGDFPSPTAVMRRCDPAKLQGLRALVSGEAFAALRFLGDVGDLELESNHFRAGGKRVFRGHALELEGVLRMIVVAMQPLRAELRREHARAGLPPAA